MEVLGRYTTPGTHLVIFMAAFLMALSTISVLPVVPAHADPLATNIGVGSSPYWAAVNPSDDLIYVTDLNSHSVSVIDGSTNAVVDTITVGLDPRGIAIDLGTDLVYVATAGGGIYVIDGATDQVTDIFSVTSTGPMIALWGVAVNQGTDTVYVANQYGSVIVINGATDTISNVLTPSPPQGPTSIAVDQLTNMVYVASITPDGSSGYLTVVNGSTDAEVTYLQTDTDMFDVAVNPSTDTIYATAGSNGILVVDGATNTIAATIAGASMAGVTVDPSVGKVFATDDLAGPGHVFTINATTDEITQVTTIGNGDIHLTADPATNMVYVVEAGVSNAVAVINGNPSANTGSSQLVVTAVNTEGQALIGYYTTISPSDVSGSSSAFTPADYTLSDGRPYSVTAYGYGTCTFDHWSDTGSTSPSRSVSIGSDTQLIAVLNCGPAGTSGINVYSIDQNGNPITGYFTVLTPTSGNVQTGFTPVTFSVPVGTSFHLQADSYGSCTFAEWSTGQTIPMFLTATSSQLTLTAVYDCAPGGATSQLQVSTVGSSGSAISGYYVTLWQGGTLLKSCFSPCSFTVNDGQTYQLEAASYGSETFDHWQNDGSLGAETVTVPSSSTVLSYTAVYQP